MAQLIIIGYRLSGFSCALTRVPELALTRPIKPPLLTIALLAAISAVAVQNASSSPAPFYRYTDKALAIYAPPPKYPTDQRGRRPTGRGIVVMEVDEKTGWVTSAKMEKSTGSKLLDDAALEAFKQWRFRPGTVRRVHSPISFEHRAQPQ
ncbi:MAG TPA: TonB family protein [Chthoniobacterales bacterium]|nr:TonB family protein [Chthoniobacterales bacterium]